MSASASRRWFAYQGGNVTLPSSYLYTPVTPTCVNGINLCSIYAIYTNAGAPSVITANLQHYIAAVTSTGVAQPSAAGQKPYAYGKTTS